MKLTFDSKFNVEVDKIKGYAYLSVRSDENKVDVYRVKLSEMAELISKYNKAMDSE